MTTLVRLAACLLLVILPSRESTSGAGACRATAGCAAPATAALLPAAVRQLPKIFRTA